MRQTDCIEKIKRGCIVLGAVCLFTLPVFGQDFLPFKLPKFGWGDSAPAQPNSSAADQQAVSSRGGANGLLSAQQGGLPYNMWQDTRLDTVLNLFAQMSVPPSLPTARDLYLKILLSDVAPPVGIGSEGPYLMARMNALVDAGAFQAAAEFIEFVPSQQRTSALNQQLFEILLSDLSVTEACTLANSVRQRASYWSKAKTACNEIQGQAVGRVTEDESVESYFEGVARDHLAKSSPAKSSQGSEAFLDVAIALANHRPFALTELRQDHLLVNNLVYNHPNSSAAARIRAAENLARRGALTGVALKRTYLLLQLGDTAREEASKLTAHTATPEARALLVQAVEQAGHDKPKAILLKRWIEYARASGLAIAGYQLLADETLNASPSDYWLPVAADVIKAAVLSRQFQQAGLWMDYLKEYPNKDLDDVRTALIEAWPVVQIMKSDETALLNLYGDSLEAEVVRWQQLLKLDRPADYKRQVLLVGSILAGVGQEVPAGLWAELIDKNAQETINSSLWLTLHAAMTRGRVGEGLLASLAFVEDGPLKPLQVRALLIGLSQLGFAEAGHKIAIEMLLASGL